MSRWQPDAPGRLQRAALELYAQRGYDATTVAEIAARAGLTERTFFRHFADKREVLFHGSEQFRDALVAGVQSAPPSASPLATATFAVESIGPFFDERRAQSAQRHAVVSASLELQERELIKRVSLVATVAEALVERGTAEPVARLAAETGLTVFSLAYVRWVQDPEERPWSEHVREVAAELRELAAGATA